MKETDTIKALRLEARRLRRLAALYPLHVPSWGWWASEMENMAAGIEQALERMRP